MVDRRQLLGVVSAAAVSLSGCVGALEGVTEEGDADDSDGTGDDTEADDDDDLDPTHEQVNQYREESDAIDAEYEVFHYNSSEPRGFLPSNATHWRLTKKSKSHDIRADSAYGAIITSAAEYDDIDSERLESDEEAFIEQTHQETEAIINFQVPEANAARVEVEKVAKLTNENRVFIEITHRTSILTMTSLNNSFVIVDKDVVADGVIIGCEERHQEELTGHVIWELE